MQMPAQRGAFLGIQLLADVAVGQALVQGLQCGVGEFLFEPLRSLGEEVENGTGPGFVPTNQWRGSIQHRQKLTIQPVHRQHHVIPGGQCLLVADDAFDALLVRQQHVVECNLHVLKRDRRIIDGDTAILQKGVVHGATPCS
ncbi:hypothetical protein D3C71_1377480 [compost metagenome]